MMTDQNGIPGSRAFFDAQSEIIDVIAAGTELRDTLRRVVLIIEKLTPPAIGSILLLDPDGVHIRHGASPSLPDSYVAAIDGLEIGPRAGSCGTAAYLRQRVVVVDIATDPLWADYRHLALSVGLKACWSQPVIDMNGNVLGTFALYYREPKSPAESDLELVDRMSRLVRVALAQDRKEQSLIETEQKLRDYLSLSSDWLWEKHGEGQQFFASSDAFRLDPEALRRNSVLESLIQGADRQLMATIAADVAARRPVRNARTAYTTPEGEVHFLNINAMPIFDRAARFLGYRGTAHDISRQVEAEAESQRLRIEAQDANRAKTEFLANISHELRTPLNAILGLSEIMEGELLGPLSERYREYAADIHQAGQHLHALVTDILNLSRIEMGRMDLDEEIVGLEELIEGCFNMLRMRAAETGVRLVAPRAADPPKLRCDRLRLKQAVLNLVSNAIKFTPKYGEVVIASSPTEDGIAISVTDNGIGMRPEDIPRALEPFRQIDAKFGQKYDGVGLGLALTKSLVELHGGRLDLASELGRGTVATIHLPASRIVVAGETEPYRP